MIIEQNRVVLEQKDLEKLFRYGIQESLDDIDSKFKITFLLSEDFSMDDIKFTIPDVECGGNYNKRLHYKFSIKDTGTENWRIKHSSIVDLKSFFHYYFVEYDKDNPTNKGIIIDIDKEEISKLKLML